MNYPKDWKEEKHFLAKTFIFVNFDKAVEFVDGILPITKRLKHHPDIDIFDYNKVKVKTMTHDTKSITEKDIELAKKIDQLFSIKDNEVL